MGYTIRLYVERDGKELELEVSGEVSAFVPAVTHLRPEDCHPDEGGEVEIVKIRLDDKEWDGELTDEERERAEDSIFEAAKDDDGGYQEEYEDDDLIIEELPL